MGHKLYFISNTSFLDKNNYLMLHKKPIFCTLRNRLFYVLALLYRRPSTFFLYFAPESFMLYRKKKNHIRKEPEFTLLRVNQIFNI